MPRKSPVPARPRLALPLVGVTLTRESGGALPPDASALERRLYASLHSPRSPLALCAGLPVPPAQAAAALQRLIERRAIRAEPTHRRRTRVWDG